MTGEMSAVELPEEKPENKLWKKTKEAPFVPIGILGLVGAVTYGAVMYKRRGQMSTSVYLMQFRVIAQSMVVGAITLGVAATIAPKLWDNYKGKNHDEGNS